MHSFVTCALTAAILSTPTLAQFITSECPGDGSLVACPCANDGVNGHGCANSIFSDGAQLSGTGSGGIGASDDTVLTLIHASGNIVLLRQGDALAPPLPFDDGLGCVTGNLIRIAAIPVTAGSASYPRPGDARVSSFDPTLFPFGGVRHYECIYRNAQASFCPASTSNRSNALRIQWHGAA